MCIRDSPFTCKAISVSGKRRVPCTTVVSTPCTVWPPTTFTSWPESPLTLGSLWPHTDETIPQGSVSGVRPSSHVDGRGRRPDARRGIRSLPPRPPCPEGQRKQEVE